MLSHLAEKARHDLEWQILLDHVASRCLGEEAAAHVRALQPAETLDEAVQRARLSQEALAADAADEPIPARALPDMGRTLPRIAKGGVASGEELRDIVLLLGATDELRAYAERQRGARERLADALSSDPELARLGELLGDAIERDGSVADSASPKLRDARRRVGEVRRELGTRLSQLMRRYEDVLRDQFWTERDGRFVLPVRSDAHVRVEGIVLGSSASGGTLYVEPQEATALGNRLKVAEAEVEREVARVLAELSARVREHADALERARDTAMTADVLFAFARFARETRAVALIPEPEAGADLVGIRHPLLVTQGVAVVQNDVAIAPGSALVISGPNAGGKTVALKCLGLAAWMARAGLPIPCEERSKIGWFRRVLTDVGDDQSLLRSLSTFSAHVANLGAMLDSADGETLILLDEVAAGTDPEEGAALAVAVLEALVSAGAAVAVTTHYERLKEIAARDGRFVNASVGFDLAAMAPTFRLTLGVPGASSALAVAERFGVPHPVIERAAALLPERALDREELVRKLEAERSLLETARRAADQELARQRALSAEMEEERKRARDQERARLAEEARTLTTEVQRARARLREALKQIDRADPSRERLRAAERDVNEAAQQIAIGGALESATRKQEPNSKGRRPASDAELRIGTRVFVDKLGAHAEVSRAPDRGQLEVRAGALRLTVPTAEVWITGAAPKAPEKKKKSAVRAEIKLRDGFVPVRTASNTLDLRGQRVDEAIDAVDAFVDRMLRVGEQAAFVLHGHGTGALKLAVRAHLAASAHVHGSGPADPDDGGDAFTVFWLSG
jgi:DNA mismatch repair protein MutS2